jgi:hypothetical protein
MYSGLEGSKEDWSKQGNTGHRVVQNAELQNAGIQ